MGYFTKVRKPRRPVWLNSLPYINKLMRHTYIYNVNSDIKVQNFENVSEFK